VLGRLQTLRLLVCEEESQPLLLRLDLTKDFGTITAMPVTLLDLPDEVLQLIWNEVLRKPTIRDPPCYCSIQVHRRPDEVLLDRDRPCERPLSAFLILARRLYPLVLEAAFQHLELYTNDGKYIEWLQRSPLAPYNFFQTAEIDLKFSEPHLPSILDQTLRFLRSCHKLQRINLSMVISTQVPAHLLEVALFKDLPVTNFMFCLRHSFSSDNALNPSRYDWTVQLQGLPLVNRLYLDGIALSGFHIPTFPNITHLSIDQQYEGAEGFFKSFPNLTNLSFTNLSFLASNLDPSRWLRILNDLPEGLETLNLSGPLGYLSTPLTFLPLKRLKSLQAFTWGPIWHEHNGSLANLFDGLPASILSFRAYPDQHSLKQFTTIGPGRFSDVNYLPNLRRIRFPYATKELAASWDQICTARGIRLEGRDWTIGTQDS
jgi:hypothetical protein